YPLANAFIHHCSVPVVAPSANLSGRPSPTTWQAVYEDLNGRIDCILQGEPTEIGIESTVVDCTGNIPILLRKGSISFEELRRVVPEITGLESTTGGPARSPGLKHKHYSPKAKVRLVENGAKVNNGRASAFIGLQKPDGDFALTMICESAEE